MRRELSVLKLMGLIRAAAILVIDDLEYISYPEPRVEMFGNEFCWGKTKVFNPSELNMAAV